MKMHKNSRPQGEPRAADGVKKQVKTGKGMQLQPGPTSYVDGEDNNNKNNDEDNYSKP